MNSAALFSPFFFDFDFLCFFLRCDPDRLFDLERPRDDEEDDDELEEEDVDLGKKRSRVSPNVKPCQHCSLKTCFFCTKFFSQDLLNCFPRFWILTLLPLPSSSSSSHLTSLSSFSNLYSCSCSGSSWASLPDVWTGVNIAVYAAVQTVLPRFGLVSALL